MLNKLGAFIVILFVFGPGAWLESSAPAADRDSRANTLVHLFKRLDRNGDGKLTADELKRPRIIQRADANGDKAIDRDEFAALFGNKRRGGGIRARLKHPDIRDRLPPTPEMTKYLNVPYAKVDGVDPHLLSLDVHAPKGDGKHPVVVMIHGGAWFFGDKARGGMTEAKAPHFVGAGYVYVSINYRLSPAVQHPRHVQDVAKALAWVHDNIGDYGGDPDQINLMGHSAGAHLAALVATDDRRLKAEGKDPRIIKRVVLLDSGAYDVPRHINELGAGPFMRKMYETAFGKDPEAWKDASPRTHVAKAKHIPNMLVFHGNRMGARQLAPEFAEALTAAGSPSRAVSTMDLSHAEINWFIGTRDDAMTKLIMNFLKGASPLTFPKSLKDVSKPTASDEAYSGTPAPTGLVPVER